MEKELLQMQFKERLSRTLLRLNWVVAVAAMLPVLSKIIVGVAVIGTGLYFLVLITITIMTLCVLLLNDKFRALYNTDKLDDLQHLSEKIIEAYKVAMPVLVSISLIMSAIILVLMLKKGEGEHKTGRIVSVATCVLFVLIATLIYYIKVV